MDDRFLSRGKKKDDKRKWVYGVPVSVNENTYPTDRVKIVTDLNIDELDYFNLDFSSVEIDPTTLGQCTGLSALKSYRGSKPRDLLIFEGDIVKWGHLIGFFERPARIAVVKIEPDIQFYCKSKNHIFHYGSFTYQQTDKALEIIGNIYDNPELLK